MAIVVTCPRCGKAKSYRAANLDLCRACGAELPSEVYGPALRALHRQRPVFLTLVAAGFIVMAALGAVMAPFVVLGSGPYFVNGEPASKGEFLRVFFLFSLGFIAGGSVAFGLLRDRAWARPVLLCLVTLWGTLGVVLSVTGRISPPPGSGPTIVPAVIWTVVMIAFFSWYLYGKERVVTYYASLTEKSASRSFG